MFNQMFRLEGGINELSVSHVPVLKLVLVIVKNIHFAKTMCSKWTFRPILVVELAEIAGIMQHGNIHSVCMVVLSFLVVSIACISSRPGLCCQCFCMARK